MPEWLAYLALPTAVLLGVAIIILFYLAADTAPIYDDVVVPDSKDQPDREPHQRGGL